MAQHTLSAPHDIWLVCRWVGPAPTLQRGVGRGVRPTSTAQLGCPSAPATLWTLQKAERASLQVSSTFCCHASGRSDLVCLTVFLQQACQPFHAMEMLPDACILATCQAMPAEWQQCGRPRQHQCLPSRVYPVQVLVWAGHCVSCNGAQAFAGQH